MKNLTEFITKKSNLFFILNNQEYNYRMVETTYINDIITFFNVVELKKELKWRNCLEIIIHKCIGFELENIQFIYVFLWKNKKTIDTILTIFDSFSIMIGLDHLEQLISNESLYDKNLQNYGDGETRRHAEVITFTNLFNECGRVILSKLSTISETDNFKTLLNKLIVGIINFSLEIRKYPDCMCLISMTNEFLKILDCFFDNDVNIISQYCEMLYSKDHCQIDLKDLSVFKQIISIIDKIYEEFQLKNKLSESKKKTFISSKLNIFESIVLVDPDPKLCQIIINNLINHEELINHSEIIFFRIFSKCDIDESFSIFDSENELISMLRSAVDNIKFNSSTFCLISEFFRKFLTRPELDEMRSYLEENITNFGNCVTWMQQSTDSLKRLVSFSGIKHYLEVFSEYLVNDKIKIKEKSLIERINEITESDYELMELSRNYLLKFMAYRLGGSCRNLIKLNYSDLGLNWAANKNFEDNNNILGLDIEMPYLREESIKYNTFFTSLINQDNSQIIESFRNLIKESKNNFSLKFLIIQFFITKVYLTFTNDGFFDSLTYKQAINVFKNVRKDLEENYGKIAESFIENLVINFSKNSLFKLTSKLEPEKVGFIYAQMQYFNLILSFPENCLSKIYYDPNSKELSLNNFDKIYFPGSFDDTDDENINFIMKEVNENFSLYGTKIGLYECKCEYIYSIGDCTRPNFVMKCPKCKIDIGGTSHVLSTGNKCLINADNFKEVNKKENILNYLKGKLKNQPGFYGKKHDEYATSFSIRSLSNLSFRLLNFFNSTALTIMSEIKAFPINDIEKTIKIKEIKGKTNDYFKKHINSDIKTIIEIINSRDSHLCVSDVVDSLIQIKENYNFTLLNDREKFEQYFQTSITDVKIANIQAIIKSYIASYSVSNSLNFSSIIDENYTEKDIRSLKNNEFYRIFRLSRSGNWEDLKNEFVKRQLNKKYHFLSIFIEKLDELSLLSNLYPIIQFTNYMTNQCNYRITRQEAKDKKISQYINNNEIAERMFLEFQKAWKNIGHKATQYGCKSLPQLEEITSEMPISFILVDDKELGYGMYMAAALQYLGGIQNEVLEAISFMIKETNNNEMWRNTDTNRYSIQKISPYEIILYQTNEDYIDTITDIYSKFFTIFSAEFGQGTYIEYNFEKIENDLALKILTNKKFLNYEDLNKVQFKFELLSVQNNNSNLITDIRNKLEQKMIEGEELNSIKRTIERLELQNEANLHNIFSSLEVILCNLRYSSSIDNITISLYCNKTQGNEKISHYLKDTYPINSIKLSNIIFFYELIEDRLFGSVLNSISNDYNQKLSQNELETEKFLDKCYGNHKNYPTCEQLINVIQRFIIRYLISYLEPKIAIKEYLVRNDFWDLNVGDETIDEFYNNFPENIFISNTLPLLQFIKNYLKKKTEEENKQKYDISKESSNFQKKMETAMKKKNKFI